MALGRMLEDNCSNFNHGRVDAQVRFYPMSGEVVNGKISSIRRLEEKHAVERRKMNKFYANCGEQLII